MRANRTFVKVKYTSSMEELLSSSFHHDGESNPSVPIHGGGVLLGEFSCQSFCFGWHWWYGLFLDVDGSLCDANDDAVFGLMVDAARIVSL